MRDRARGLAAPYGVIVQAVLDPDASLPNRPVELVDRLLTGLLRSIPAG